jgi:ABC-2 type transport system ATP-binding protein
MLEFRNVTKKYLRRAALDDVSFTLDAGRVCLLLGPNGSGKTTAMKLIAGLSRQTSGEVLFEGQRIGARSKAHIAYMPTENYFYSYMSVKDAGKYYEDFFADFDARRFDDWLRRMELNPEDKVRQLSSGMAAKLRLSLILSRNARLMLFDEPLNGVDILTRTQVISEIIRCRAEGRAMIISTHLVEEMDSYIDHVVFMRQGEIVKHGSREELTAESTLTQIYLDIFAPGTRAVAPEGGAADV